MVQLAPAGVEGGAEGAWLHRHAERDEQPLEHRGDAPLDEPLRRRAREAHEGAREGGTPHFVRGGARGNDGEPEERAGERPQAGGSAVLAARDSGGETGTVSDFLAERVGPKAQKQGGVNLTDICKIRFLMAGTQRLPVSWQVLCLAVRPWPTKEKTRGTASAGD